MTVPLFSLWSFVSLLLIESIFIRINGPTDGWRRNKWKGSLCIHFIFLHILSTHTAYTCTDSPQIGVNIFSFGTSLIVHWHSITTICLNLCLKSLLWTWLRKYLNWQVPPKDQSLSCFTARKLENLTSFLSLPHPWSVTLKSEIQGGEDVHRSLNSQNETSPAPAS